MNLPDAMYWLIACQKSFANPRIGVELMQLQLLQPFSASEAGSLPWCSKQT